MASTGIPYFRFYPADFMHGVRGMSAQEVGVYTMILCRIYEENGSIERNDLRLATYCGMRLATFVKVLEKLIVLGKISDSFGLLSNRRSDVEMASRANDLKNNSKAGKASAEKRQQNQQITETDVKRLCNHTDTDTDIDTKANALDGKTVDFAKAIFENGVRFLVRNGSNEKQARTIIGKWRKDFQDREIFDAIAACNRAEVIDPIPWITAKLQPPPTFKFDLSKFGETA